MTKHAFLLTLGCLVLSCGPDDTTTTGSTGTTTTTTSSGAGGGGNSSTASCADTWSSYGQSFFAASCTSCHSQFSSQATVQASASAIASEISTGRMPERSSLTSAERTRVLAWLSCGAL